MPSPTDPRPPKIPTRKRTAQTPTDGRALLDGDSYAAERYDRADLTDRDLRHSTFSECTFTGTTLTGADLTGAHLVESDLTEVEAASLTAPRSLWRHSTLSRSRLGAVVAYEASFDGLVVADTKISFLNARSSTWKDVLLQRCVIDELDLVGAKLTRVRFENCQIRSSELTGTTCRDVDLRSAELREISGLAGLGGCTISPEQLYDLSGALAAHLGIVVAVSG
ncbi:MAG TPA: pentapeptide repeat-containing protein [Microlunatus sp.]|nr:pentapeptide repeat-containing protein [Microlunatus sp.]